MMSFYTPLLGRYVVFLSSPSLLPSNKRFQKKKPPRILISRKEMPHPFFNAIIVLLCACAAQQREIDWNSLVLCGDVRSIYLFVVSINSSS